MSEREREKEREGKKKEEGNEDRAAIARSGELASCCPFSPNYVQLEVVVVVVQCIKCRL